MKKVRERVAAFMRHRGVKTYLTLCTLAAALSIGAFAADPSVDMAAAFSTGFQKIVTDSIAMISAMLPIAITLAGALFLVKKGMAWFKSVAK